MPTSEVSTELAGALGLLERAVGYTRAGLWRLGADEMGHPTPCRGWDLSALLHHMYDSLGALREAADAGFVGLDVDGDIDSGDVDSGDIVSALRTRASALLGAWTNNDGATLVSVAGSPLAARILVSAGACEIAVHGWDVARARGQDRPVPPGLASEILELAPLLVHDADRPARFAAPVAVPAQASPSDRLLGFLGRR